MKLTIESTDILSSLNGCPVRIWNGRTESGVGCIVYVAMIQVPSRDSKEFERALLKEMSVDCIYPTAIPTLMSY